MKVIRIPALLLCLTVVLACSSAIGATYTVTNAADTLTPGTLRWAITSANTNAGADTISFNLGASASITPTGQLPRVTNAFTTIDGTTQSGYSITNLVRIYGNSSITNCLDVTASNCTIKALAIYGYRRAGIFLHQGHNSVVQGCHLLTNGFAGIETTGYGHLIGGTNAAQRNVISANTNGIYLGQSWSNATIIGNFIGTDVTGMFTNGNTQSGIYVDSNSGNLIGSVTNGARNIISGNAQGIYLNSAGATRNVIVNNYIGLASNGTSRLGNWNSGIYVDQAPQNRIGGTNVSERNYISANLKGIVLYSFSGGSFSNVIQGNYIGLDTVGAMKSNDWYAIEIQHSPSNVIGGAVSGAGNVIGGGQYGIKMEGTNTCGTIIQGNKIGTDPSGTSARPIVYVDIALGESRFSQVGGTNDNARNVISGSLGNGITTDTDEGGNHVIEGNYIGLDLGGTVVISNLGAGVSINRPGCRIGGTNAANRNVISGNGNLGVFIGGTNATNIVIYGNYIGVDATGTNALGNGDGGVMTDSGARDIWIGKGVAGCGNVISGNGAAGVELRGGSRGVRVLNNYIGVDATGARLMTNTGIGVNVSRCGATNYVGGTVSERNVIAGNAHGISVANSTGVVIRANLVGVGTNIVALGNGADGINLISTHQIEIGGATPAEGNLIGGSRGSGILLNAVSNGYVSYNFIGVLGSGAVVSNAANGISIASSSDLNISDNLMSANGGTGLRMVVVRNCTVTHNFIGTDATGSAGLGNMADGIYLDNMSFSNVIGGIYGSGGNLISGNSGNGILFNDTAVSNTIIIGNKIGTDVSGAYAIGNKQNGITLCGAQRIRIGGTNVDERNIISGNNWGISLGCGANSNLIQGNYIGVDYLGTNAIPNAGRGIWVGSGVTNTTIGGTNNNAGNIIAFNRDGGVVVFQNAGNSILGNSIFRNEGLGIDLGADSVTANDNQDPDVGANMLQNYPVILSATNDGANAVIKGYLDSKLSKTYLIELFGSRDPDLTGFGEGQVLMGRKTVTTDGSGMANFTGTVSTAGFVPNFITATATDSGSGDTSEFSYRFLMDTDGDGMGDGYEVEYLGGYTNGNPGGHADSDGVDNLGEFLAETDPTVASSCLRVMRFGRESWGDRFFVIPASDCRGYSVQIAWDLMGPAGLTWWDWPCSMDRTNSRVTFTEGSSTYNPTFYRVIANVP